MSDGENAPSPTCVLLEGPPGVGKTTVAQRLIDRCRESNVDVHGFTTREQRSNGQREGFEVVPAGGGAATVLAHVDLPGPPRVGRYGVDLPAFESIVLPLLLPPPDRGVVVIDELGRMELSSATFCRAVEDLFEAHVPIVATVHTQSDEFTDGLRRRADVEVVSVTPENRGRLPSEIAERLTTRTA